MYKIYLAGPFFNEVQVKHAKDLAMKLEIRGYTIFAPVTQAWKEGSIISPKQIFKRNLLWMQACDFALCQLDYPLEEHMFLKMIDMKTSVPDSVVQLPDSGTVWEMGYLHALHKCIVGYCAQKTSKINLMLAQGMDGFVEDPLEFFYTSGIEWQKLKAWKGEQV